MQQVNSSLLSAEAASFAKANTFSSTVQNARAGPSERQLRAQHRQNRLQQPQIDEAAAGMEDAAGAADITDIEAAASLVDLMAHETLQGKCLSVRPVMPICIIIVIAVTCLPKRCYDLC